MNTANPIVMTLDAGGTNLVFSAICNGEGIVTYRANCFTNVVPA